MTDPLPDTWTTRELPVLREAIRRIDDPNFAGVRIQAIAEATGLSSKDVLVSLRALEGDGLVELRLVMPAQAGRVVSVTGDARRIVGSWPTAETALDRMLAALEQLAEGATTPEERTGARKLLDTVQGVPAAVMAGVMTAAINGQLPQ